MMLQSFDPALPYYMLFNGSSFAPVSQVSIPSANWRWSVNPAEPNVQWGFAAESIPVVVDDGLRPLPPPGADDDLVVKYDVTTGQIQKSFRLPFAKLVSSVPSGLSLATTELMLASYGVTSTLPSDSTNESIFWL